RRQPDLHARELLEPMMNKRSQSGFTLVELMAVVVVAAILLMVTVPSFVSMLARMRIEGSANELTTDLQYARAESLQRGANVTVQITTGGTGYTVTCAGCSSTIKTVNLSSGITVAGGPVTFSSLRGMSTSNADVNFALTSVATTASLTVTVPANSGSVQLCGSGIPGYSSC
ncbi:MAG TPA: GspH/FimT family pseudopilin, partial [Burkholderiaceae bacterium]|nr:GspH/FimT family pseudopilin [Burkholderiaceae bacterium]